jgi:iron complex transport system substrate-binding protein
MVYALGLGDSLYGVSHECDYPQAALEVPKVVYSALDNKKASSGEIDAWIKSRLVQGKGIYEIDGELLREADPDIILTQDLCEE